MSVRQIVGGQLGVVAGTGVAGFAAGAAAQARLDRVRGLAVDSAGTIYVVEQESHRIRTIANGTVSTVAGNGVVGCLDGPAASGTVSTVAGSSFGNANARVGDGPPLG